MQKRLDKVPEGDGLIAIRGKGVKAMRLYDTPSGGKQDNHEQRLYLSVNGGGVFCDLITGYWTYVDGGVE